jgi:hypothetical protein
VIDVVNLGEQTEQRSDPCSRMRLAFMPHAGSGFASSWGLTGHSAEQVETWSGRGLGRTEEDAECLGYLG